MSMSTHLDEGSLPQNLPPSFITHLPPFFIHAYDFFHHFAFFFLLPIATVVASALVAASVARSLHRALFSRFATPDELLESALVRLKKDEHSRKGCDRSFLASRKKTLDKLRLVIQLKPDRMKAYTVLATELLYEDINNSAAGPGESGYNNEEGKKKDKQ